MRELVAWILWSAGVAALVTWWTRRYALRRGLLDIPGARRSHTVPTPRGGGISIVVVMLAACGWLAWREPAHAGAMALFGGGLVLIAAIGWLDDHHPLPASRRFIVHLLSASLLAVALFLEARPWWQIGLGWLLAVSLVNIWNFMDGINGLAVSQAAIAAAGFALLLPPPWTWVGWAFCAACMGFVPFNFPDARIFLGDVGSGALGYLVAGLATLTMPSVHAPLLVFLPLVLFCIDAGFTLLRRVLRREAWWQPHATHAYQRAARRAGHTWVTVVCAFFSLAATILMVQLQRIDWFWGLFMIALFCLLAALGWMLQELDARKDAAKVRVAE